MNKVLAIAEHPEIVPASPATRMDARFLTAVQVGLLTVYDMCKAVDRGMVMSNIRVMEKHGGKSGDWSVTS